MITKLGPLLRSSVFKKQMVAITGLALVGFIIVHLAGNLIIFLGPEAFNHYSETLHAVPELLWIALAFALAATLSFTAAYWMTRSITLALIGTLVTVVAYPVSYSYPKLLPYAAVFAAGWWYLRMKSRRSG